MCGIAGYSRNPRSRKRNARRLAGSLARAIEHRGPHATGAAWSEDGWPSYWKEQGRARKVIGGAPIPAGTETLILHTRYATHGGPSDNVQNHPHVAPGIVLVHNGTLANHSELLDLAGHDPVSECDSEAIPAILSAFADEHPADVLPLVRGDAAVAWIDTDNPLELHLARVQGRPLWMAQTKIGDFFFASTPESLIRAMGERNAQPVWLDEMDEGTYVKVREGRLVEESRFKVQRTELDARLVAMTEGVGS